MLPSLGRRFRLAMAALLPPLILAAPAIALAAGFCVVHPLNPLCCPSPCPVVDMTKVTDFLGEAEEAWQKVEECRQVADQYASLFTTFGPSGPTATELRRLPGAVASAFASYPKTLPDLLKSGPIGDPRAMAETIKAAWFVSPLSAMSVTDGGNRAQQRATAAADESLNAVATGLRGIARLTDVAVDGGQRVIAASKAGDLRGDWAANTSSRQALIDNLGGLKELLSSWATAKAMGKAISQSTTMGALPPPSTSASAPQLAASLQSQADQLNRLRQIRLAVDQLDATVSALTALHNERHAVAIMLAQYPGLQTTIASHDAAVQFRTNDATTATALLSQVFVDAAAAFEIVKSQLLSLDTTGWKDNATKSQAASAAAQAVVQVIATAPQTYGASSVLPDTEGRIPVPQSLAETLAAWLEDDKLERFWQPLRQNAEDAMGGLDRRLVEINQRRGFDMTSSAAAGQEQSLLAQFAAQVQPLSGTATSGLAVNQQTAIVALVSATQQAASAVQSDASAQHFVTVVWPQ